MNSAICHHTLVHDGVSLHYVTAGSGPPLLLIHGFPQTWHQWRHVIDLLAGRFRIIAPDLRGIGAAPGPATGYDKQTMATDMRAIVIKEAGEGPVTVVGHDMGSFVAFSYALHYPEATAALGLIDAPMPGTALYDLLKVHPRAWHIAFHCARDVPEMLLAGRERQYIEHFVAARIFDMSAITAEDIDIYTAAYAAPGAMRAALEMYRAIEGDCEVNRALLTKGKLKMPVAVIGGDASLSGGMLAEMAADISEHPSYYAVDGAAHWIPEEQPAQLAGIVAELAGHAVLRSERS